MCLKCRIKNDELRMETFYVDIWKGFYMKENIILIKTKQFALNSIEVYKYLTNEKKEYIMSKQFLKSSTSIGANAREGSRAQSKADFVSKMNIALKEADETLYWLELLKDSGYLDDNFSTIKDDCEELVKILVSIVKNS